MQEYDKDSVPPKIIDRIRREYTVNPLCTPAAAAKASRYRQKRGQVLHVTIRAVCACEVLGPCSCACPFVYVSVCVCLAPSPPRLLPASAAEGLCKWVQAMDQYDKVAKVRPYEPTANRRTGYRPAIVRRNRSFACVESGLFGFPQVVAPKRAALAEAEAEYSKVETELKVSALGVVTSMGQVQGP